MPNKKYTIKLVDDKNKTTKILHQSKLFDDVKFSPENIVNLKIQCDTNGMIHSKKALKKVGKWNTDLTLYEDFEFLLRFVEHYSNKIVFVPKVLVAYTRTYGKDSLCSKANYSMLVDNLNEVYKLHGKKNFLKAQTWYPQLRDKYQEMAQKENKTGYSIVDRLIKKYNQ